MLKNNFWLFALLLVGAVLVLGACVPRTGTAPLSLTPTSMAEPLPLPTAAPFRVIGYITPAAAVESIPYDQLTHINYAFLIPKADGTFETLPNAWKLEQIVANAHQHKVRVLISVGGWGWDAEFEALAADPARRAVFVKELTQFVDQYQLDGADIDWEYPDPGVSAQNFLALIQALRAAMPEKLITTAVLAQGETAAGILPATFEIFDFVNIMAYDGGEPHSSYEFAESSLHFWLERGLPPEKTVLGLPFYAHPNFTPYWKIVQSDPQAAYQDEAEYLGATLDYNGIPTIERKTRLAQQLGSGVMIWTVAYDSQDDTSLLQAIQRVLPDP